MYSSLSLTRDAIKASAQIEWILILYLYLLSDKEIKLILLMHFVPRELHLFDKVYQSCETETLNSHTDYYVVIAWAGRRRLHKFFRPEPLDRPGVINLAGDF